MRSLTLRAALAAASLSLVSCSVRGRSLHRYAGTLTSADVACPSTKATLTANDADAVFSPSEGTWTLSGRVQDGSLTATRSRPGVEHRTYATTLDARVTETAVTGTYRTPTCNYAVALTAY